MRKVAHIKLSSEEAEAMIQFADTNGDGLVSFDDFVRIVNLAQNGSLDHSKGSKNSEEGDDVSEESIEESDEEKKKKSSR